MKHSGTEQLKTNRLILRKFMQEDYKQVFDNWTSKSNVALYTTWEAHENISVTQNYISWIVEQYKQEDFYCWGIEYKGKLVGEISVVEKIDNYDICGIGYVLGEEFWGKGIMTEACSCILDYLFEEIGYRKIIAGCDELNIGSSKVLENVGMTLEAILRQHIIRKNGTFGNNKLYGIFLNEFQQHNKFNI
ncbi:GNAT family N-acetyltransferase [Enterococcus gallinarum]|uniref:GNAT family N-acetyltransferase n=1 Tax=Enterococcus gallinarum TaxID=1353 RepID=UPI001E63693D|nr:GNAT family protein [Enterococcus gallinarum]